jgi:hypothetical protein
MLGRSHGKGNVKRDAYAWDVGLYWGILDAQKRLYWGMLDAKELLN